MSACVVRPSACHCWMNPPGHRAHAVDGRPLRRAAADAPFGSALCGAAIVEAGLLPSPSASLASSSIAPAMHQQLASRGSTLASGDSGSVPVGACRLAKTHPVIHTSGGVSLRRVHVRICASPLR